MKSIEKLTEEKEYYKKLWEDLTVENSALRIVNDGHKSDIANLKQQITQYDAANAKLLAENKKLKEMITELRKQIKEYNSRVARTGER